MSSSAIYTPHIFLKGSELKWTASEWMSCSVPERKLIVWNGFGLAQYKDSNRIIISGSTANLCTSLKNTPNIL